MFLTASIMALTFSKEERSASYKLLKQAQAAISSRRDLSVSSTGVVTRAEKSVKNEAGDSVESTTVEDTSGMTAGSSESETACIETQSEIS